MSRDRYTCSQCGASGLDVSKVEGTPPEGFRALCPGRMDGSDPERLFCEKCASGAGPGTIEPAPLVLDVDAGTIRAETRRETKARKARTVKRSEPAGEIKVRSGPVNPARAAKYVKAGIVNHKHAVWVTLAGQDDVKIGEGTPERCASLASALRSGEVDPAGAVAVVREMDAAEKDERAARKGKKS